MKRTVWFAVTILVMICILGFGLHTLNNIDEVNQRRRDKEAGKVIASQIAVTTANTSIWDKLRETTTVTSDTMPPETDENGDPVTLPPGETLAPDETLAPGETAPAGEETPDSAGELPVVPDAPAQEQTTTVTTVQ